MSRKQLIAEQIINKLREAVDLLSQERTVAQAWKPTPD